jgi:hypothetical protein
MTGYRVGSQAWYDITRKRMVEISKDLRRPDLVQEHKDRLYLEQLYLVDEILRYGHEGLVKKPIE